MFQIVAEADDKHVLTGRAFDKVVAGFHFAVYSVVPDLPRNQVEIPDTLPMQLQDGSPAIFYILPFSNSAVNESRMRR